MIFFGRQGACVNQCAQADARDRLGIGLVTFPTYNGYPLLFVGIS